MAEGCAAQSHFQTKEVQTQGDTGDGARSLCNREAITSQNRRKAMENVSVFKAGLKRRSAVAQEAESAVHLLCRLLDITAEGELRRAQLAPFAPVLAAMITAAAVRRD
jgi:hypothetical protein